MYSVWTQHIKDQEDKDKFKNQITNAKPVLRRLREILSEDELALDRSETDIKSFDLPNWDYKQAYKNGYRARGNTIDKLINLDQQEP